ncbi:MAG: hypothetical protein ABI760_16740 [Ferruginibacter sp.]
MKLKNLQTTLMVIAIAVCNVASAQLFIDNAQFFIQPGATVTVQGDVTSNVDIQGTGLLQMKGTALQSLNMNGFTIPNLEIDNTNHVALTGAARVSGILTFTNGKLQLGANNFTLASTGSFAGTPGANKFVETNGAGLFRKEISAIGNYNLPIGTGSRYEVVQYQVTGGASFASAFLTARSIAGAHPNKHPRSTDYLNEYWSLTNGGITGGSIAAVVTYNLEATDVTGVETDLRALYWNGTAWVAGTSVNNANNTITFPVAAGASQDLYGMNQYVLLKTKAFLQGTYNTTTARMNDRLRTSTAYVPGVLPASNVLPTTDPYRSAPYNFVHVNNPIAESVISASFPNPFIDQANPDNNIVDWVYLELRSNVTPGNTVTQTRSALIQRDGDIVDVDGVSPVYFKNVPGASYTVAIRHRNHLAMSTNPATFNQALALAANPTTLDFTTSAAGNVMGIAGTNYLNSSGLNFLYAGNANFNTNIRWSPPSSDKDYILNTVLGGNAATVLSNTYSAGDMDLNRGVRWSPPSSDKDYLLSTPLSSNAALVKSQVLPN